MADKTVNVNIKYNVDTSQVQKAEAASRAAQGATDKLRKSVEDYGKASSQAAKASSDALKKTSSDINSLAKDFNGLYTSVKAVVAAGLVREFVDMSISAARLSGQIQGVKTAFDRLPAATQVLQDLRDATKGTVTDLELMQKALLAQNFGISLKALPQLLEFAAVRAQQTGQNVDYLVNSIVNGIGRKSLLILDNLQLSATAIKDELGGVSLQMASVGQVSEAVGRLAEKELNKMGGLAVTSATRVDQLSVSWDRLKVAISKALTQPALLDFYDFLVKGTTDLVKLATDGWKGLAEQEAKRKALEEVNNFKERELTKEILADRQKTFDVIQQEANTNQQIIGRNNDEIKQLKERLELINKLNIGEATRNDLYGDRFSLEGKDINQRKKTNIEFAETIREEQEEARKALNYYSFRNVVLKESIKILNEFNKEATKANNETIVELRDKILGPDTLSGTPKPKKSLLVPKLIDNQELVNTAKQIQDAIDKIGIELIIPVKPAKPNFQAFTEFQQAFEDNLQFIKDSALNNTQSIINSEIQRDIDAYSQRIEMARSFYDEQVELAGDNERAKKEIRIKEDREIQKLEKDRSDREKKAAQAGILVNTALAIIKIFAGEGTYADKIIRAAIMAGEGATQYAIASRARYYAKGEINIKGPGSETSDSIPAMLSKGESIMTAKQTREAFGILTDVRSGKLNDKILRQLVSNGGSQMIMDDSRIVDAIKRQPKPPDLVKSGRQIYEVYTDQQSNKRFIRSKSMG